MISEEISINLIAWDINTTEVAENVTLDFINDIPDQSNPHPTTNIVPANSLVNIRKRVPSDTTEDPGVIVWAPTVSNAPERAKKALPVVEPEKSSIVLFFFQT